MADITIGDNHRAALARMQHVAEHLTAERARLETELRYVLGQMHRCEAEVAAFVRESYGVDVAHVAWTLDTERGVIVVPDPPDEIG